MNSTRVIRKVSVVEGDAGIVHLASRNNSETPCVLYKYMHIMVCIARDARTLTCVGRCSAMSLAPGCVFTLKSFLLSRCAYKTAPDDGALVIKA